jgi:GTP-binding protein
VSIKKLGAFIGEEFKACILVVNKWDLAKGKASSDDYAEYLGKMLPQLSYAPIAFTTQAKEKIFRRLSILRRNFSNRLRQKFPRQN